VGASQNVSEHTSNFTCTQNGHGSLVIHMQQESLSLSFYREREERQRELICNITEVWWRRHISEIAPPFHLVFGSDFFNLNFVGIQLMGSSDFTNSHVFGFDHCEDFSV
jgi:hypothetical protein